MLWVHPKPLRSVHVLWEILYLHIIRAFPPCHLQKWREDDEAVSDWLAARPEGSWAEPGPEPPGLPQRLMGPAGRGLRRGGRGLVGRMRGGGCCSMERGWRNLACCWRGGGWRCKEGVAGSVGRRRGGGWWTVEEVEPEVTGIWAEAEEEAAGDALEEVTWPCRKESGWGHNYLTTSLRHSHLIPVWREEISEDLN